VVAAPEAAQPLGGVLVGHEYGPRGVGGRVSDVGHDHRADLVAGEQVAAAESAERDRQVRPWSAVGDARLQVDAGRPVDRDDRHLEVQHPLDERRHWRAGRAAGSSAKQRVHRHADARPRPVGRHLAHALGASAGRHGLAQLGAWAGWRGDPDR
jgi:hypothetical protein